MLDAVLPDLRCPVCGAGFVADAGRVVCGAGHAFDVARQGYLNLTSGSAQHGTADTAAMVAARETVLGAGHFEVLAAALAAAVGRVAPDTGLVVDVAGGTGYYLGRVLDALPGRAGVCVDLSSFALRRAARAHPRAAAVGADVWRGLPLRDACAAVLLSVFGPRNAAEFARVLAPDGVLVVVTPTAAHLAELVEPLGMLRVDADKDERTAAALGGFSTVSSELVEAVLSLSRSDAVSVAAMGPTGQHVVGDELAQRAERLTDRTAVTLSVRVTTWTPTTSG